MLLYLLELDVFITLIKPSSMTIILAGNTTSTAQSENFMQRNTTSPYQV